MAAVKVVAPHEYRDTTLTKKFQNTIPLPILPIDSTSSPFALFDVLKSPDAFTCS